MGCPWVLGPSFVLGLFFVLGPSFALVKRPQAIAGRPDELVPSVDALNRDGLEAVSELAAWTHSEWAPAPVVGPMATPQPKAWKDTPSRWRPS